MNVCAHGYGFMSTGGCLKCAYERKVVEQERQRLSDLQAAIDRRTAQHLADANITLGPKACPECGIADPPTMQHSHQTEPLHMDPEIVICAAVLANDGSVFRCHRHHDGLRALHDRGLDHDGLRGQGFVTSRNRFVDRREALQLQLAAGIESVAPGGYRPPELYSEDLY